MVDQLREGLVVDGRFRLIERLGAGRAGAVWRAADLVDGTEVAVKTFAPIRVGDAVAQARFRLVARTVAQLSHPAIAQVHDYGLITGPGEQAIPYLVRELARGPSLQERLASGPLPVGDALRIVAAAADALAVAHRAGVAHGNIAPANIMLAGQGVKVTDFGLSALRDQPPGGSPRSLLAYPAPEVATGSAASPAADMYSLGVVFVTCLTGITADVAGTGPAAGSVPAGLAALWAACLGANPQDRPSAAHVAVMSRQILADPPAGPVPAGQPAWAQAAEPGGAAAASQASGAAASQAPGAAASQAGVAASQPAQQGPPAPAGQPRRVRLPGTRRARVLALGGAVTALAAGMIALTQIPSSTTVQPAGATAGSSAIASLSPSAGASVSTSARTASPEATSSVLASSTPPLLSPLSAITDLSRTVRHGVASGAIRQDVGVDFENLIKPAQADLASGQSANVPQLVSTLRAKLAQRVSEGAVTLGMARTISGELDTLQASAAG